MPLYSYMCASGHPFDRYLKLAQSGEPQRCECGAPAQKLVSAPFVRGDLPDYVSPVTGELVSGRKARREDLVRHGCVEYEPSLRAEHERRRAQEESRLDHAIEETVEAQLHGMPARKRELLDQELRAGAGLELVRKSA